MWGKVISPNKINLKNSDEKLGVEMRKAKIHFSFTGYQKSYIIINFGSVINFLVSLKSGNKLITT